MRCDEAQEHLSAYLDRELTAELSDAVRAHLDACPDCRAVADGLRATADLLGRLPVRSAPAHVAADVQREIERRLLLEAPAAVEGRPPERTLATRRARQWTRALAVAATVVVAVGIGVLAYRQSTITPPPGDIAEKTPQQEVPAWVTGPGTVAVTAEDGQKSFEAGGGRSTPEKGKDAATETGPLAVAGYTSGGTLKLGTTYGLSNSDVLTDTGALAGNWKEGGAVSVPPAPYAGHFDNGTLTSFAPSSASTGGPSPTADASHAYELVAGTQQPAEGKFGALSIAAIGGTAGTAPAKFGGLAGGAGGGKPAESAKAAREEDVRALVDEVRRQVAKQGGLQSISNQLVLRADSDQYAGDTLKKLFANNDWQQAGDAEALQKVLDAGERGEEVRLRASGAPAGAYLLASTGAEQTWVVLADRDSLPQFARQLAECPTCSSARVPAARPMPWPRPIRSASKCPRQSPCLAATVLSSRKVAQSPAETAARKGPGKVSGANGLTLTPVTPPTPAPRTARVRLRARMRRSPRPVKSPRNPWAPSRTIGTQPGLQPPPLQNLPPNLRHRPLQEPRRTGRRPN